LARREPSAMIVIVLDDELDDARPNFEDNILSRVESQGWFLNCLDVKYVQFTPPPRKPMGGRIPASEGGYVHDNIFFDKKLTDSYLAKSASNLRRRTIGTSCSGWRHATVLAEKVFRARLFIESS
jgi:hypothetical protein